MNTSPETIVLVEGVSDKVAVETLAAARGIDLRCIRIHSIGGATNIFHAAAKFAGHRLIGLCDAAEKRHFERALTEIYICDADLEDEFIRSLGVPAMEQVLAREGDLAAFRVFQNQPAQREREVDHQLRRFLGTTSGRKEHYGRALAAAVETVPEPLRLMLDALTPPD
jgi:hypothetical protein